jgi:poly-gamma-glutamate biosynthesis protein PgsC/CapC
MEQILTISIGLGLIVSLMFSEILGVAAGGMIVPGYIALNLDKPLAVILTLLISWLTYFVIRTVGMVMILYGRRRTVLTLLVGFILGTVVRLMGLSELAKISADLNIIGYIIPGLIAIWIERQGLVETFSALITSSVIVRLILILITRGEFSL